MLSFALLLGAVAVLPSDIAIANVWRFDALRSLGALFPLVALCLFVRAWHRLGWTRAGTLWGLVPMAVAVWLARLSPSLKAVYLFGGYGMALNLVQPGLVFCMMESGILLCIGGVRLCRACLFPLALLLLVNPVPRAFNLLVDLPLQQISAATARHFANALGLSPSGADLQLLFTPSFGMTIVPGCNGSRGALTLGYLALLLGYLKGFRAAKMALCMAGAMLLGYLLNFVRLCLLVFYYAAARHAIAWQGYGEAVDYCIGGAVFLTATAIFAAVFFRGARATRDTRVQLVQDERENFAPMRLRKLALPLAFLCVTAVAQTTWSWPMLAAQPRYLSVEAAMRAMPMDAGPYHRTRTWTETDKVGKPGWVWGAYADERGGPEVVFGLWLSPVLHFGIDSERAHGRFARWTDAVAMTDREGVPVQLLTFATADAVGGGEAFSAETTCTTDGCSDAGNGFKGRGLAWASSPTTGRERLPMLLRVYGMGDRARGAAIARAFYGSLDTRAMLAAEGR